MWHLKNMPSPLTSLSAPVHPPGSGGVKSPARQMIATVLAAGNLETRFSFPGKANQNADEMHPPLSPRSLRRNTFSNKLVALSTSVLSVLPLVVYAADGPQQVNVELHFRGLRVVVTWSAPKSGWRDHSLPNCACSRQHLRLLPSADVTYARYVGHDCSSRLLSANTSYPDPAR